MQRILLFLVVLCLFEACSSGKTALKHGEYYEAVIESINRLRGSPDNKKAIAVLSQGYPLAIEYIETNIQNGITADDPSKWRNAVKGYEQINNLNDQIKTSLGAMKVISKPATRFKELADAKTKAAEESYNAGINEMMKNTRDAAKTAYFDFKGANDFEPGYRESLEMMNRAEFNATLRVAYEEINASRYNYGSFEPIINSFQRQFLSFRPAMQKDTVPPHQLLRFIFNDYSEEQRPSLSSRTEEAKRDIKTGEKTGPDGKKVDVMSTVTAKVTYYRKVQKSRCRSMLTITDASNNATLINSEIDGDAVWQNEWATFTGDPQALSATQANLVKQKESYPNRDYLYQEAMNNLQVRLKGAINSFYSQY